MTAEVKDVIEFADDFYAAGTWSTQRRVIARIIVLAQGSGRALHRDHVSSGHRTVSLHHSLLRTRRSRTVHQRVQTRVRQRHQPLSESNSEPVSPAAAHGSLRDPAPLPQHRVGGDKMGAQHLCRDPAAPVQGRGTD